MLWNLGLTRLDSVYLSHADQDHYNALPDLLDRFQIGELVIPSGFVNEQNPGASLLLDQVRTHGIPVRTIAAPSTWNQGSTQFTVLHPPPDWHPETPDNARSLVLDVAHGGRHLLLTGDLDQLGLVELVAQAQPEPIDLMLAPHHGGKSANTSMALFLGQAPGRHRQPADDLPRVERCPHAPGTSRYPPAPHAKARRDPFSMDAR